MGKLNHIVLSGADGWFGKNFLLNFQRYAEKISDQADLKNCRITALVKNLPPTKPEESNLDLRYVLCDITDRSSLQKIFTEQSNQLLVHAAGVIHPKRIGDFYQINVEGFKNLLDIGEKNGLTQVIALSSNSPFGCNPSGVPFSEKSPYNPYLNYGESKKLMEIEAEKFANRPGFCSIVLRPPWFYGPNQPERQANFIRMIANGVFPLIGGGKNLRSMVYTENLVNAVFSAISKLGSGHKAYWISDEQPYRMIDVINTIREVLKGDFSIRCRGKGYIQLPGIISTMAYAADWSLQKLSLYDQRIHVISELNKNIFCDISKARAELGYQPTFDLRAGMRLAVEDLLKKGFSFR